MDKRFAKFLLCFPLLLALTSQAHAVDRPWSYHVTYDAQTKELLVDAELPSGSLMDGDVEAVAYFRKTEVLSKGGSRLLGPLKDGLMLPQCPDGFCRLRYRFALGKAADKGSQGEELEKVKALGNIILSNPSFWVLRPVKRPDQQRVEFTLSVINNDAKGKVSIASGLFPIPGHPGRYFTSANHLDDLPWTIVGPYFGQTYAVKGATIDLAIIPADYKVDNAQILAWSQRATDAITAFYGAFPLPHALVVVVPRDHYQGPGKSFGDGGAVTINPLGLKTSEEALKKDWVMTHEMVHLAFPSVPYRHHWMEEGLATYVEPLARIRSGELKPEDVFRDMVEGMPQGLPKAGDGGLDGPPNWSKTYWGGALFALLADKELRVRSKGKVGLDDALRGIVQAGGTMAVNWDFQEVLRVGDQTTGYPVLSELYSKMKDQSPTVDLKDLWKQMGVERKADGSVHFQENAPLAYVRHGMIGLKEK